MEKIYRKLSMHEASFPVYSELSPGAGNIVSILTMDGHVAEQNFKLAIEAILEFSPIFRSTYAKQAHVPLYYWKKSNVPVHNFILSSVQSGEDFDCLAQRRMDALLNEPFLDDEALCRFELITNGKTTKLLSCINHGLMDGSSVVTVNQLIAKILMGQPVATTTQSSFPTALWEFMPYTLKSRKGILYCFDAFLELMRLQKKANSGFAFAIEGPAPASEHRCMVLHKKIPVTISKQFLSLSKQRDISVHGLLVAAISQSFVDYLRKDQTLASIASKNKETLPVVSTMDLRRRVEPTLAVSDLGCYSSGCVHEILPHWQNTNISTDEYCSMARLAETTLTKQITKNQHWKLLRIYQLFGLSGMKHIFKSSAEKPMSMPLSLANLGRLNFPESSELKVTNFEIAPAFHANGPSINIQCYTLNDELILSFAAARPQISRTTLEAYADRFIAHINAICSTN